MKVLNKIQALLVLVLLIPAISSCAGGKPVPSASEIVSNTLATHSGVNSYRLSVESMNEFTGEFQGKLALSINGVIGNKNQEMQFRLKNRMAGTYEGKPLETTTEIEVYLVGGTFYWHPVAVTRNSETVSTGRPWRKITMPAGFWETKPETYQDDYYTLFGIQDLLSQQLELLKTGEVVFLENGSVEGDECYVLQVTKSYEEMWRAVEQQLVVLFLGTPVLPYQLSQMSVKHWIDKRTSQLRRANVEMTSVDGKTNVKAMVDISLSDYNKTVSIVLPAEAERAQAETP
jgi:hypothetical protein